MPRKLRSPRATDANGPPRRRRDLVVPAVPTFHKDPPTPSKPSDKAEVEPEVDPAEDAVRRMVEAAYT